MTVIVIVRYAFGIYIQHCRPRNRFPDNMRSRPPLAALRGRWCEKYRRGVEHTFSLSRVPICQIFHVLYYNVKRPGAYLRKRTVEISY